MMDVLIKGLALPKKGELKLTIDNDGYVSYKEIDSTYMTLGETTATELPPHGDLIERSPLVQKIKGEWQKIHEETGYDVKGIFWNKLVEIIESSEVVLEAST